MVRALGYSQNTFDPANPGRLCRGRERWIEPFDLEGEPTLYRLVVSGAEFSDDSAADARRGLGHSGFDIASIVTTLLPRRDLVAFVEDGHPADIPDEAEGVELYTGHRGGGRSEELMVRWFQHVSGLTALRQVVEEDEAPHVLGFAALQPGVELDEDVRQRFFLLTGMGSLDSPPARFQPAALPDVLEVAKAVVLLHRDKHGPVVAVYTREPLEAEARLRELAQEAGTLPVRFAIPPMLARWDRALAEAREAWMASSDEEFPVPAAPEPSTWEPRRGRRRGRDRAGLSEEASRLERRARSGDEE
ncbi:MAG: hypothetical protein H6732_12495 [Alphaproteobacteria bacterium]|nr:hypothetical protein [Alphaproteobacteria bacterium]